MSETRAAIEKIFLQVLSLDSVQFNEELLAGRFSGWNSLNHMRIIVEIEKLYGISFKPKEVVLAANFDRLLELVQLKRDQQKK